MHPLKPPSTVFHGTDSDFDRFDIDCSLGAHFGTKRSAIDRLRSTGRLKIEFQSYPNNGEWYVREMNWSNRPAFEHGPFDSEDDAECFCMTAPGERAPIAFEIDVYRPLEVPDLGTWEFNTVVQHLARNESDRLGSDWELVWSAWNRSNEAGWNALKACITEAGFDCLAYRNETEDAGSVSWIVMDADKIHKAWTPSMEAQPMRERMRA